MWIRVFGSIRCFMRIWRRLSSLWDWLRRRGVRFKHLRCLSTFLIILRGRISIRIVIKVKYGMLSLKKHSTNLFSNK